MAIELRQFGAQSATFLVTDGAATLRAAQWAELPSGKLKDLFSRVYTTGSPAAADDAAFAAACADAGFSASGFSPSVAGNEGFTVSLNSTGVGGEIGEVEVSVSGSETGGRLVRLITSYSASE